MNALRESGAKVRINLSIKEADNLCSSLIKHASELSSPALNLSGILKYVVYGTNNRFRQPPHAWEPGIRHPSTKRH